MVKAPAAAPPTFCTYAAAQRLPPGYALGGVETQVAIRSGDVAGSGGGAMEITLPASTLFVSENSATALLASTTARRWYVPVTAGGSASDVAGAASDAPAASAATGRLPSLTSEGSSATSVER